MGGRGASSGAKGGGLRTRTIGGLTLTQNQKFTQLFHTRESTVIQAERTGEMFSHSGFEFGVVTRDNGNIDVIELKSGANIGTTGKRSDIPQFVDKFQQDMKSKKFQRIYKRGVLLNEAIGKHGGKVSRDEYSRLWDEIDSSLKPKRKTK